MPGQSLHHERIDDEDYVPADYQLNKQPLLPQRLPTTAEYIRHIDGMKEEAAQGGNEWLGKIMTEAQSIMIEESVKENNKKKQTCITSFFTKDI